ncbi:MAG TPA: methionyl-tRNA formyltransferase [Allosphingosinicella sp.]|nr:methionyl-tRNA formyltransferase [Allosphingosinicella sp.]
MRIAFMGTPEFAVPTLDALVAADHEVVAVYSQPPRPAGRGKALRPSPVQQRAEGLAIPVRTPLSLKGPEAQADFAALDLDVAVVAAYGLILPRPILEAPRRGCLNVHASILPRWRGAAPIQRAILAGDRMTGVTIMKMEEGLDTGPMMAVMGTPIRRKTAGELIEELARLGGEWMIEVLDQWHRIGPRVQPEEQATYAPKISKAEARLDFTRHALQVDRQVRAFNPVPGAWFEFAGERLKLLAVDPVQVAGEPGTVLDEWLTIACGEGGVVPTSIQRAGRAPMSGADLLRGFPIPPGSKLG